MNIQRIMAKRQITRLLRYVRPLVWRTRNSRRKWENDRNCSEQGHQTVKLTILGGIGGRDPPDFGHGGRGSRRVGCGESQDGSWMGREILLYLVMYRKYVRKWWLLKRNRMICPEVAVNEQFLAGKSKFFLNMSEKIEIFRKFAWKNRFFGEIVWKNRNFVDPDPRPQISN